eukprot:10132494-Alexandrium_andersonii.AAC.1
MAGPSSLVGQYPKGCGRRRGAGQTAKPCIASTSFVQRLLGPWHRLHHEQLQAPGRYNGSGRGRHLMEYRYHCWTAAMVAQEQ